MRQAEQITTPLANHGEGPFWDSRSNRLLFMDVFAGAVIAISSDGEHQRYLVPSRAATTIRRRATSGFVIATEHGLAIADDQLETFEPFAEIIVDSAIRTNDGSCDPLGGFVIGTMSYTEDPGRGAVYRVSPDHQVAEILAPVSISNGIQFSADSTRVYYIDTPTRRVDMFDVDPVTGAWSNRRTHIRVDEAMGFPDGMAIDEDDGLWIALWGGGGVHHYDNAGRFVEKISVPGVTQVSSCTFGGDQREHLFITTSRNGHHPGQEPAAGAVFMAETTTRGAALAEFAG
jgi:sugar lactone lactonase YvrE